MKSFRLSLLALLWLPAAGWAEVNFYLTRAGTGIDGVTQYGYWLGDPGGLDLDLWVDTGGEDLAAFDCDLVASESGMFDVTDRVWQGAFAEEQILPTNNAVSGEMDPVFPNIGAVLFEDIPGTSFPMLVQTISIQFDTWCVGCFTLTLADMLAADMEGVIVNELEIGYSPFFTICALPEPASLMLAAAGGLALLRRRGRSIG